MIMYYIYILTIFLTVKHVESAKGFNIFKTTPAEHIYSSGQVQLYMYREQIVPLILNVPPRRRCQVSYPNLEQLRPGDKLFPNITNTAPHLFWRGRNDTLYTIYMIGWRKENRTARIRAFWPKRLKKYLLHGRTGTKVRKVKTIDDWDQWIVVNVPNNHVRYGDTLHKYTPPPPTELGLSSARYIFVIFQQKSYINMSKIEEGAKLHRIPCISRVSHFAMVHNLGEPLAGNYFIVRRTNRITGKKSTINKRTRKVYTPPSFMPTRMQELVKILDRRGQFKFTEAE